MVEEDVTFTFPEGWTVEESNVSADISSATDGTTGSRVSLSDSPDSAAPTLDQAAENALKAYDDPALKRVENVTMGGGAEAYQIRGKRGMADFWEFGTIHNGARVYLGFTLAPMLSAREKRELIDSVLASAQWAA
ncbi:hypothetical protein SAMN05421872_102229 [Nocardioides lianchengensis]|uniref:Uncharacterized protein n=2 Tax=Nocardioides lianchengensis TaxID=1045774 RepID=A0A1G6LGE9_9ACTN|nr:hypothetical protein SAMN05421872_102229 [Nocardioides lianchengensis]